jgi:hypothetical protein
VHRKTAKDSDQPFAALIKDLKARGLFDDTIIVCRLRVWPHPCGRNEQRIQRRPNPQRPRSQSAWLHHVARRRRHQEGLYLRRNRRLRLEGVDKPVHVHDIHATILYLLGIDHTKLTYRYSGRDYRLTDVSGNVIHDIIA